MLVPQKNKPNLFTDHLLFLVTVLIKNINNLQSIIYARNIFVIKLRLHELDVEILTDSVTPTVFCNYILRLIHDSKKKYRVQVLE